jgi:hypothetical protein
MRYINIDNFMNKSLSFRAILTKVTFITASVVSLILNPTCFVLGLYLGTFILAHVLVKCHLKAFVALSRSSVNFLTKPDTLVYQIGQSGFDRLIFTLLLFNN